MSCLPEELLSVILNKITHDRDLFIRPVLIPTLKLQHEQEMNTSNE